MFTSRGLAVVSLSNHVIRSSLLQNGGSNITKQIKRHSGGGPYYYRSAPPASPTGIRYAELMGGFMWWWLVWHFLTDYHELIGNPYPKAEDFTDEELGIPPASED